ncbi:class F sortase [Streptomyces sp. NPDC093249]|uniref:class F sortase n=1 Tax=unclassified Streptomyces TaxID=2593676 RepID=UPI003806C879
MASRRPARLSRRRRRLFRLARTVTVTVVLVGGGAWWAGGEEPAEPQLAVGPAAPGLNAVAAGAATALDHKAKAREHLGVPPHGTDGAKGPNGVPAQRAKTVPPPRPGPPPAPLARSRPTAVAVPAITIEAPVVELGLDGQGRLATPPVDNPRAVGWYAKGATPGERGTAVVVGHRDTRTGPAVFLNLNSLSPGNTVRIARADGRVAVFTVDRVQTYTKAEFPDKEVYGSTGRPELRLLTCGGSFDRRTGYEANIVVFAHLTDIAQKI